MIKVYQDNANGGYPTSYLNLECEISGIIAFGLVIILILLSASINSVIIINVRNNALFPSIAFLISWNIIFYLAYTIMIATLILHNYNFSKMMSDISLNNIMIIDYIFIGGIVLGIILTSYILYNLYISSKMNG